MKPLWHDSQSIVAGSPASEPEAPVVANEIPVAKPVLRVAPPARERRDAVAEQDQVSLRTGLTVAQLDALATLEQFHWTLRFVRRPMFHGAIPIVFSPDGGLFVVLEQDGAINEHPGFKIRP